MDIGRAVVYFLPGLPTQLVQQIYVGTAACMSNNLFSRVDDQINSYQVLYFNYVLLCNNPYVIKRNGPQSFV